MIKCKALHRDAQLPIQSREGDAGYDLCTICGGTVPPMGRMKFGTGLAIEIPMGNVGIMKDRSKLANKHGITVLAGVVDSNYRGEVNIVLYNTTTEPFYIASGSKVAQMVICNHRRDKCMWDEELSETNRGVEGINCEDMRL